MHICHKIQISNYLSNSLKIKDCSNEAEMVLLEYSLVLKYTIEFNALKSWAYSVLVFLFQKKIKFPFPFYFFFFCM